jgi:hypothetical protein
MPCNNHPFRCLFVLVDFTNVLILWFLISVSHSIFLLKPSGIYIMYEKRRPNHYETLNRKVSSNAILIRDGVEGAGLSLRRPGFDSRTSRCGIYRGRSDAGKGFSPSIIFFPVIIIPPTLHTLNYLQRTLYNLFN